MGAGGGSSSPKLSDQPQDHVAEALARHAHGRESSTTPASSQTAISPFSACSRSKPTLSNGSVATIASKALEVIAESNARLG